MGACNDRARSAVRSAAGTAQDATDGLLQGGRLTYITGKPPSPDGSRQEREGGMRPAMNPILPLMTPGVGGVYPEKL